MSNDEAEAFEGAIELFHVERLAEVAVAAVFERRFFHAVNVKRGDGDDWNMLAGRFQFADLFDRLEPVDNRHVQIDKNETRTVVIDNFKRFISVFSFDHAIPF